MADPRLVVDSKDDAFKNPIGFVPNPQEPPQAIIDQFNKEFSLVKGVSALPARESVANKLSQSIALGTTATLPVGNAPIFRPVGGSATKLLGKAGRLNPYVLGATLLVHSEPLGGDSHKNITNNLRLRVSDDNPRAFFEKQVGDAWQATGVSAFPTYKNNKIVSFEGLSEKDAKLIGLPTTFPITPPETKLVGGFEAYQGDKYTKLDSPLSDTPQIHSTQFPVNNDLPTAGLMESRNEEIKEERERKIDQYLIDKGHSVEINPREGVDGAGRQGDRYVDGNLTEYKTLIDVKKTNSDGLSSAISNRAMNSRGQASHIIIDARKQAGMTEEIAKRGIKRAFGTDDKIQPAKISEIRVIGNNFDISVSKSF